MRGFDGKDAPLLMEGIASMVFKDSRSKTLYRFTVPGLLSSSGNTLISANQLKRQDGIGYSVPGDESPSSLYTGNPRNPTREIILDTMFNGLDCLTPLSASTAERLVNSGGYTMRDFTSSTVDVIDGNTRCMQIIDYQSELVFYEPTTHRSPITKSDRAEFYKAEVFTLCLKTYVSRM